MPRGEGTPPSVLASRRSSADGSCLESRFRGETGQRVLTLTHVPAATATAGVVVCSPIGSERVINHRRELVLAATLADRGLVVERFHYRGTGDSDGRSIDLGFDSMVEDTVSVARRLCLERGLARVAILGTRLGSVVAAAAAREFAGAPVALWEPVVDPEDYFDEIFRYKLIQDVMQSRFQASAARRPLRQILEQDGFADILGFPLGRKLFDEACERRLAADLGAVPRPTMITQIRSDAGLSSDYSKLRERLLAAGSPVEIQVVRERVAWWFLAKFYRDQTHDEAIVATAANWLETQLADS